MSRSLPKRRRDNRRTGRLPACIALGALLFALALALAACGTEDDPFAGLWWEPSTGRRIEIRQDGEAYRFFYGVGKRPYRATRAGDELRIREPMGGTIVVRTTSGDGLELLIDGESSSLQRVP